MEGWSGSSVAGGDDDLGGLDCRASEPGEPQYVTKLMAASDGEGKAIKADVTIAEK